MRVSDNVYLQTAIKKWTKWGATMDIVGCSLFGSRYLRSALNVQFHAPPQVNSRHMPCASLHAAAPSQCLIISIIVIIIIILIITIIIIILIIIIRLAIRIFRHPFAPYPTVRWKWQVRASIGTAKRHIGVCANTDRVFFPARCVCLTMYTSKWLSKNGLSDEQPWTSWGALFSDPDISALLWMSSSMPPPKWTLVTCLVRLFTQQPLRSVSWRRLGVAGVPGRQGQVFEGLFGWWLQGTARSHTHTLT